MSFAAFNVRAYFFSCLCYDISPVCFLPCSSFFSAAFCLSSFSSSSFLHCFFASSAFLLYSCSNSAALFLFCSFIFCCLLSLPLCEYVLAGTVHLLKSVPHWHNHQSSFAQVELVAEESSKIYASGLYIKGNMDNHPKYLASITL